MGKNLPVPAGPRAPVNWKWFPVTGLPAGIIWSYRTIFLPKTRADWNNGVSTSHKAMAAVLAPDGGWKAFKKYTTPRLNMKRRYGFTLSWMLLIISIAIPKLRVEQSWAN